jgi:hypothetical protein
MDAIQLNDRVYARGVPVEDGTFIADAVWVNIVNLHGEITGIQMDCLQFNHDVKPDESGQNVLIAEVGSDPFEES